MKSFYELRQLLATQRYPITSWEGQLWMGLRVLAWTFIGSLGFLAFAGLEYLGDGPLFAPYLYGPIETVLDTVFTQFLFLLVLHVTIMTAFEWWSDSHISLGWAFGASLIMLVALSIMFANTSVLFLLVIAFFWALNYPLSIMDRLTPRTH